MMPNCDPPDGLFYTTLMMDSYGVLCFYQDMTVIGWSEGVRPFSALLKDDGEGFPKSVDCNPMDDVVILPYSSGTTGLPKGVMLTHYNVVTNLIQLR